LDDQLPTYASDDYTSYFIFADDSTLPRSFIATLCDPLWKSASHGGNPASLTH
jgi:hypothetical protein